MEEFYKECVSGWKTSARSARMHAEVMFGYACRYESLGARQRAENALLRALEAEDDRRRYERLWRVYAAKLGWLRRRNGK
jgi:hypothetical protein